MVNDELRLFSLFNKTYNTLPDGWFFSEKWSLIQKVNGRVYCYITIRLFDGFILQLYKRGETGFCDLEYRSHNIDELFAIGEEILEKYKDGNLEEAHKTKYSPYSPNCIWHK